MRLALRLLPGLWLALLVAAPLLLVGIIALSWQDESVPPYSPPWAGQGLNPANLRLLLEDPYYRDALLQSLTVAAGTAALCLLLAAPMGIAIARAGRWRGMLLGAVLLPFWTGFLIRIGAWIGLLRDEGWINTLLAGLGLTDGPIPLLYTDGAMLIGMVHAYLPFAVLPVFAAATRLDPMLEQAAADLGATPGRAFLTVTLPQLLPALAAAFLLVFIPAAGEYVIPELLGPPDATLVGRVLFQEFFQNRDWPVAGALAVALLLLLIGPIILFQRLGRAA
ncbi:ABC transporter permease subunit [Roseomonas sp. SSH11]|uniref:ABC transporter permease subunit n=1 Tax=Pararoseomonas baculiformis TaxID=2820812 RepID=A0ABS4AI81_9PROT|nr:ABC transporter permease subunit [Pararoseomonas baculiformis]MBP0446737.1 ABC transporter permease subunit [Pararoseomonas baculiformis]